MSGSPAGHGVARAVARATDELRRGEPVRIIDGARALTVLAAELATSESLAALETHQRSDLIITPERAATLRLMNQRPAAAAAPGDAVVVVRAPWLDLVASLAAADPASDLDTPLKGPFPTRAAGDDATAARAAILLAKRAGLLPSLFAVSGDALPDPLTVSAADVLAAAATVDVRIVSRARLPLDGAEDTEVIAFRPADGGPEHLALRIGRPGAVPLVRLHSACLTGDVLGSLKCDCGPQLRAAVARLAAEGGILLYLQQEGRGIGLMNKLRAYRLQDQGFDTVDANLRLGFGEDERDFAYGAAMLRALGVERVRLLTNNPAKVEGLAAAGIAVAAREPHVLPANPHNRAYLDTKRRRQRHFL